MTRWLPIVAVALLSSAATAVAIRALDGRQDMRAYLLEHPEVLPEAMERLRLKQAAAQIAPLRRDLETPFARGYIGAERADVTLVQFFDYACGYCRASLPDLQRLVREDPKVRIVFRELPILSPGSEAAARASLAAAEQGRYGAFHSAMYAASPPNPASIAQAVQAAGLDTAQLQAGVNAAAKTNELHRNIELAQRLGFTGTPSWVIGDQTLSGAIGYDALKEAVAKARASRS